LPNKNKDTRTFFKDRKHLPAKPFLAGASVMKWKANPSQKFMGKKYGVLGPPYYKIPID
jgi:hypothetical protein